MNIQLLESIALGLKTQLQSQFGLNETQVASMMASSQNTLSDAIKQYVMKNGSKDIESILLKQSEFEGSAFQAQVQTQLKNQLQSHGNIEVSEAQNLSQFASKYMVDQVVNTFQSSEYSKDLDGICAFLGIDKNLLKMVNSPVGKMFGKFF